MTNKPNWEKIFDEGFQLEEVEDLEGLNFCYVPDARDIKRFIKNLLKVQREEKVKKCLNCGTKLIEKRNKVIKEIWDRDKSNLSMKELADIFTIPLPTLYRIIKKQRELNFMKGRGEN